MLGVQLANQRLRQNLRGAWGVYYGKVVAHLGSLEERYQ
jgi:hypothetical protein